MSDSFGKDALHRSIKLVNKVRKRLLDEMWKNRFLAEAALRGGTVVMGEQVRFSHPVRFMGKGKVVLAEDVVLGFELAGSIGQPILLQPREPGATIEIGRGTWLMNGSELIAREHIAIGEQCRIGSGVTILDSDFHGLRPDERNTPGKKAPVSIGNNVWFGNGVVVLKGVTVGDDAVLAARAVVTRDVQAGEVVAGNPAKHVKNVTD